MLFFFCFFLDEARGVVVSPLSSAACCLAGAAWDEVDVRMYWAPATRATRARAPMIVSQAT